MGHWFAPKRFGYGAGRPVSWQGWAVTILFVLLVLGASLAFSDRPILLAALLVPLVLLFQLVAARTTRGGWRWRWGGED